MLLRYTEVRRSAGSRRPPTNNLPVGSSSTTAPQVLLVWNLNLSQRPVCQKPGPQGAATAGGGASRRRGLWRPLGSFHGVLRKGFGDPGPVFLLSFASWPCFTSPPSLVCCLAQAQAEGPAKPGPEPPRFCWHENHLRCVLWWCKHHFHSQAAGEKQPLCWTALCWAARVPVPSCSSSWGPCHE